MVVVALPAPLVITMNHYQVAALEIMKTILPMKTMKIISLKIAVWGTLSIIKANVLN
jgi:hypothetical protein